jgi:hypothetical protein
MAGKSPNPGTEGVTPGNGAQTPFGNGKGGTQAVGPYTGAHDFLTDPSGSGPKGSGRDFTKESRPQPADGAPKEINADSIPAGGRLPFPSIDPNGKASCADVGTKVAVETHKPFKL